MTRNFLYPDDCAALGKGRSLLENAPQALMEWLQARTSCSAMEQEITEGSRLACSEAPGASACLARHRGEWVQWAQKHTTGVYESV